MKKAASKVALLVLVSGMFFNTGAFAADTAARLTSLQAEQQTLIEKYNQLNAESQKIQIRLIEIQGAIKELNGQKEEVKK